MSANLGKLQLPSVDDLRDLSSSDLDKLLDRSAGILKFREKKNDVLEMLLEYSIQEHRADADYIVWVHKEKGFCLIMKRTSENEKILRNLGGVE